MNDPDPDEEALRAALLSAILSGLTRCDPARISKIPELTGLPEILLDEIAAGRHHVIIERVALWSLMRAAAALGYNIRIGIGQQREEPGRLRVARTEPD